MLMNYRQIATHLVISVAILAFALSAAPVSAASSCESLTALKLPDTAITAATAVAAGPIGLPGGPRRPLEIPAFCRVQITVKPSVKIEVWLPTSGWNGNFLAVGNGGYAGSISYPAMATALIQGYATASTDTGHEGNAHEAAWALGHP